MSIVKTVGTIVRITDLTKTAKEVTIKTEAQINFIPGQFVNLFMEIGGEKVRRAYSISSTDFNVNEFSVAIRLSPDGKMSPLFWQKEMTNEKIELMGPLGLNTADKMKSKKVFLFAYGIGAGVIKSLASHFSANQQIDSLYIVTGSRFEDEIVYRDYFDTLAKENSKVKVFHVISKPTETCALAKGYIQDNIEQFDFNNSDVYVCGQETACNQLVEKIKTKNPTGVNYLIEGFH